MDDSCCEGGKEVMLLACSGGSNVGQLSNQAVLELDREGFGKMFCLVGIGGHLSGFVQSAKDVPVLVAIDGCPVGCAKAILDHAGIEPHRYVIITELGIVKTHSFDLERDQIDEVKNCVKAG
ncbi:MAG: putative zinc-binding protein [Syntrophales bacterium]|nr:putative zinc-binding protein [Syntrophales bacterium]